MNYTRLCSHFNVDSGKLKTFFILTVLLAPSAKEKTKCVQERTQLCSLSEIWENTIHMKYEQQIWNNNIDILFLCVARSSHFKQGQCCWFAYELLCKQCCSWCRTNALHMKNAIKACERGFKIGSGAGCVIYGSWGENSRGSPARRTKYPVRRANYRGFNEPVVKMQLRLIVRATRATEGLMRLLLLDTCWHLTVFHSHVESS